MSNIAIEGAVSAITSLATEQAIRHNAELIGLPHDGNIEQVAELLVRTGVKSQGDMVVLTLNCTMGEGKRITPEDVTRVLAQAFPTAKIGKRHGPHYMSLARTGKLNGLREDIGMIPHAKRVKAESKAESKAEPVDHSADLGKPLGEWERKELVAEAKRLGLKYSGGKEALVERIQAAQAQA